MLSVLNDLFMIKTIPYLSNCLHPKYFDDIPHRSQSRSLHRRTGIQKQLHQLPTNTRFNHRLNLLILPVGQIGYRPARIGEHLLVTIVNEIHQRAQGDFDAGEERLWFASAEVAEGPGGVSKHAHFGIGS